MSPLLFIQGRPWPPEQLGQIRGWIAENPTWSRYRLSRELSQRWHWVRPNGQLADMAARSFLLKLHERELIVLPPKRCASPNRMKHRRLECVPLDRSPVAGSAAWLRPAKSPASREKVAKRKVPPSRSSTAGSRVAKWNWSQTS